MSAESQSFAPVSDRAIEPLPEAGIAEPESGPNMRELHTSLIDLNPHMLNAAEKIIEIAGIDDVSTRAVLEAAAICHLLVGDGRNLLKLPKQQYEEVEFLHELGVRYLDPRTPKSVADQFKLPGMQSPDFVAKDKILDFATALRTIPDPKNRFFDPESLPRSDRLTAVQIRNQQLQEQQL